MLCIEAHLGHVVDCEQGSQNGKPRAHAPVAEKDQRMAPQPWPEKGRAKEHQDQHHQYIPKHECATDPPGADDPSANLDEELDVVHCDETFDDPMQLVESG